MRKFTFPIKSRQPSRSIEESLPTRRLERRFTIHNSGPPQTNVNRPTVRGVTTLSRMEESSRSGETAEVRRNLTHSAADTKKKRVYAFLHALSIESVAYRRREESLSINPQDRPSGETSRGWHAWIYNSIVNCPRERNSSILKLVSAFRYWW